MSTQSAVKSLGPQPTNIALVCPLDSRSLLSMVSQVVENQTQVSKISNLLACTSTSSEEICLYFTKRQRRAIKNRAFPELEVNFQGLLWTKSFCEQFLLKNIKLEKQLLLKSLLVLVIFVKVYLVKMSPIFDGSHTSCLTRYQKILSVCSLRSKNVLNST